MVEHLPAHDVPQLVQVVRSEVPICSVTASDIFVNAMQIDQVHVQCFLLQRTILLVHANDKKKNYICMRCLILTE